MDHCCSDDGGECQHPLQRADVRVTESLISSIPTKHFPGVNMGVVSAQISKISISSSLVSFPNMPLLWEMR